MPTPQENYLARMKRVLDHLDQRLDDDLDAASGVAAFSRFHFHRQFSGLFGISVHRYVQLSRLKRASFHLAYRDALDITEIAEIAGYDAPGAFARAFRRRFGQSPSEFRKAPDWVTWLAALEPLNKARRTLMPIQFADEQITIREVRPIKTAVMEHRGDPAMIGATLQRFIHWRKAVGMTPRTHETFNIFYDDPRTTPPLEYRLDLCVATDRPIDARGEAITAGVIPGGRRAVMRVVGSSDALEAAALYLYRDWLPASAEELGDFPLYCQRLSLFPEVAEADAVVDLFLPLQPTG